MADRRRVHTTLPCRNPHQKCSGLAVCRTSRLIEFQGKMARLSDRYCELCGRHTQTIEFESRVLFTGRKSDINTTDDHHCRKLF